MFKKFDRFASEEELKKIRGYIDTINARELARRAEEEARRMEALKIRRAEEAEIEAVYQRELDAYEKRVNKVMKISYIAALAVLVIIIIAVTKNM